MSDQKDKAFEEGKITSVEGQPPRLRIKLSLKNKDAKNLQESPSQKSTTPINQKDQAPDSPSRKSLLGFEKETQKDKAPEKEWKITGVEGHPMKTLIKQNKKNKDAKILQESPSQDSTMIPINQKVQAPDSPSRKSLLGFEKEMQKEKVPEEKWKITRVEDHPMKFLLKQNKKNKDAKNLQESPSQESATPINQKDQASRKSLLGFEKEMQKEKSPEEEGKITGVEGQPLCFKLNKDDMAEIRADKEKELELNDDMVMIHNGGEEKTPPTEKGDYQVGPVELKAAQVQRKISIPHSASKEPADFDKNSPAEIIMNFSETDTIPPEKSLSNMFRYFGPIHESLTEVDRDNNRARVVFRKAVDAEVAYDSAGRYSIFGAKVVKYELRQCRD